MTASPLKADIVLRLGGVGLVPKGDIGKRYSPIRCVAAERFF